MQAANVSRRTFLKQGFLASLGFAFAWPQPQPLPGNTRTSPIAIGRVATPAINVYKLPSFTSERVEQRWRDELIDLLEEFRSPDGPAYNPYWYRIATGFIHRGHVQRIDFRPLNEPLQSIPENGLFGEVTVPYTRTFYQSRETGWSPLYRLYYKSVHWIRGVIEQPDGLVWYRLFDPKNDSTYFVPATHIRPIATEAYSPIHTDVPEEQKRIVVSIEEQTLTAYEGDTIVMQTLIASGVPSLEPPPEGEPPTDTPRGSWRIQLKTPSRHMGDGHLTSDYQSYELPGVPWTMAFHEDGYALHGSYWHNNFGRPMSHGCINMRNPDALWLFRWSEPRYELKDWYVKGLGTLLIVI